MRKQYGSLSHAEKNLGLDCYIHGTGTRPVLAPYKPLHDTAAGRKGLGKGRGSYQLVEAASGHRLGLDYCGNYQLWLRATSCYVE